MVRFFENAEDDLEAARIAKEFGNADELGKANKAEKFEGVIDNSEGGKDGDEVDNCHGGEGVVNKSAATFIFETIVGGEPAEDVVHNKDSNADFIDDKKEADIIFEKERNDAKNDNHDHGVVVKTTEAIRTFVGLDDGKNATADTSIGGFFVGGGRFGGFVGLGGFIGLFGLFGGDAFDFDLRL